MIQLSTILTTLGALGWIASSICFDYRWYCTPGMFVLVAAIYFAIREIRVMNISGLAYDFSDDDDVVCLK